MKALFVVPKAVADKLPENLKDQVDILNNRQSIHRSDMFIQATPMYNLPEDEYGEDQIKELESHRNKANIKHNKTIDDMLIIQKKFAEKYHFEIGMEE